MDQTQTTPNTGLTTAKQKRTPNQTMLTIEAKGLGKKKNKWTDTDNILGEVLSVIVLTINPLKRIASNLLHRDICGAFGYLHCPKEVQN